MYHSVIFWKILCFVIINKARLDVVQQQLFLQSLYEESSRSRGKGKDEKSLEELFQRPILHRQINGDEVYIPLDLVRLGWKVES